MFCLLSLEENAGTIRDHAFVATLLKELLRVSEKGKSVKDPDKRAIVTGKALNTVRTYQSLVCHLQRLANSLASKVSASRLEDLEAIVASCVTWLWSGVHSDSHTPYEVFLNKFLWPMCWSFGIWLEWGSGLRTFKFTAPLENLVLSWVRCVVGDDCVEILRVGFAWVNTCKAWNFPCLYHVENKNKIKNVFNFCTLFHTFSKSMSRMQRMSLVLSIACKKVELQSGLSLQSIAKSMRRQTSSGRCSAVSRSIHKAKTWVVQSRQRSFQWYLGFENRSTNDAAVPLTLAALSLRSIAKSMRRQTSSGRCSAVSRSIHKSKNMLV